MKESEKRGYFRVRDELALKFRELEESQFQNISGRIRYGEGSRILHLIEAGVEKRDYQDKFSAILDYLISIDRKLDALIDLLERENESSNCFQDARTLDISGSGIRFLSKVKPERRFIEVILELPTSCGKRIRILSEIVRMRRYESDPNLWEIAATYREMEETERDMLISYLLKKEREYISSLKMDD